MNVKEKDFTERIRSIFEKCPKGLLIMLPALLGILLLCGTGKYEKHAETTGEVSNDLPQELSLEAYTRLTEEKLTSVVGAMQGVTEPHVMVSFESSFENVYANNAKLLEGPSGLSGDVGTKTSEKQMVLAGNKASGEEPVLLKQMCPKVRGVLVVCGGGDNENTKKRITEAASALFGISEDKIFVTS